MRHARCPLCERIVTTTVPHPRTRGADTVFLPHWIAPAVNVACDAAGWLVEDRELTNA